MGKSQNRHNLLEQVKLLSLVQRGILFIDEAGQILGANELALESLGYDEATITAKMIFEINPRYSLFGWKKKWERLHQETEIVIASELLTQSGVLFPVTSTLRGVQIEKEFICCYLFDNLLESNRYKDLLELTAEIAQIGGWEYDLVSNQILLTKEVNQFTTYQKQEVQLGLFPFLLWLRRRTDRTSIQQLLEEAQIAIDEGKDFDLEIALTENSNTLKVKALTQVSEGITAKVFGTVQNISSISARSEEMYMAQFTIDNAIEMIFWVQPDRRIKYANQAVLDQLGYTKEELYDLDVFEIAPQLDDKLWENQWEKLRKQKHIEIKAIQRTKNGELIPVYTQMNYLTYKGQEYNCTFTRNLSLKEGRDDLLDLTYQTLNQSNDIIFWVRPDRSLIYFNDTASQLLGYSRDELEGSTIDDIHDKRYDFFDDWEQFKQKKNWQFDHQIKQKNGQAIPVEATITYVAFRNSECACVTYRTISDLRKKERELQKASEEIEILKEKLKDEKTYLRGEIAEQYNFNNIITGSPKYKNVLRQLAQVATTEATVLVLGETGTGKELLARSIHQLSDREDEVLVKVNCAALPENLIESELFGHEKGAFTGAHQRKIGRFELAHKGTIFLDEIGELPLNLQSKLLRVLQEGEFERLGSTETLHVDVRVIAATNRNLEEQVEAGKFRKDLFYRLNVFPIRNLPLRERKEDIPLLIQHFVKRNSQKTGRPMPNISQRSIDDLMEYEFPGNVRELENIVERAFILTQGDKLNLDAVINRLKEKSITGGRFLTFEEKQREYILEALERTNWKITGHGSAAELLDMHGKTLASKMRKLEIKREDFVKNK